MQQTSLNTAKAVVEALGGPTKVGRMTGRTPQQVWNWKRANRFPGRTYLMMTEALAALGCTAPAHLWQQMSADEGPSRIDPPFACPPDAA